MFEEMTPKAVLLSRAHWLEEQAKHTEREIVRLQEALNRCSSELASYKEQAAECREAADLV